MSEENLNPEDVKQESQEPVELSPVEQEALEQGWVPKEDFRGDEHKWVDAAEFLRRGELFKKIDLQNRELKDLKRGLLELSKHHKSVQEVEYKRALDTLRKEKKQALEDNDADAVIAVDEQIDLIKEQQRALESQQVDIPEQSGANHPEFVAWTSKNPWYNTNRPMRAFADALGNDLRQQGLSPSEVLVQVEKEVRKEFASKFKNPNQERRSGVEAPTGRSGKSSGFQLTAEERSIMNTIVRTGALTEAEYIRDLKKLKGVE